MQDTAIYKKKLEDERGVLVRELSGVATIKNNKSPDDWEAKPDNTETDLPDPNEVGDRIGSYENNTALVQELESQLRNVDAALEKISKGTYGTCETCDKPIETDRLDANPSAKTCKAHM